LLAIKHVAFGNGTHGRRSVEEERLLIPVPDEEPTIADEPRVRALPSQRPDGRIGRPEKLGDVGELLAEDEGLRDGVQED
jgi:hypothetical protein